MKLVRIVVLFSGLCIAFVFYIVLLIIDSLHGLVSEK